MRVFCLQGSLGRPSRTASLVTLAQRMLIQLGADVDLLDLAQIQLPPVDPNRHGGGGHPETAVQNLIERARAATAFVWASPVYHNSYSGVLKSALDHLSIDDVADKPVALCSNGGRTGSTQPIDHLRIVARGLHGVAIPRVLVTRNDHFRRTDDAFLIADREMVVRMFGICQQLVDYATALGPIRAARDASVRLGSVTLDRRGSSG